MTSRKLTYLLPLCSVALVFALHLTRGSGEAYIAAQRWITNYTEYITDSLGSAPFPSTTPSLVNTAAARWSQASTGINFRIVNFNGQIGPTRMRVSSGNFSSLGFPDVPGANSLTINSSGNLSSSLLRLNTTWSWNTSCTLSQSLKRADVLTILLHEMGHSVRLLHDSSHTEAVMWPDFTCKQTLRADDRAGIDALY
jgi:Matrixin